MVVPGESWLFGTVLPWRVNWPILREFISCWCPMGMIVDRIEILLSGTHLTEQLVECWHGFYARVILTFGGSPTPALLPFGQLWAPLPHVHHTTVREGLASIWYLFLVARHCSSLIHSEVQWFDWLPLAVQASVLLLRPIAFRLQQAHDAIRGELPVCPTESVHFALIPALTPPPFPIVIVVKISFPPMMQLGAIFCSEKVSRLGLLRQLGLADQCRDEDEPCACYKNGIPTSEHPIFINSADFVSCHKGRSYTLVEEDCLICDTESVVAVPPHHNGVVSGVSGQCLSSDPNGGPLSVVGLPL